MRRRKCTCRRTRLERATYAAFLALVALMVPAGTVAAKSQKPTTLQAGRRFYQGKTITMIIPSSPGGGMDTSGRLIGQFVAAYLGAQMVYEDISNGTTIQGENILAASQPTGLTIGETDPATDLTDAVIGRPGLNFNPERLAFIGGTTPLPYQFTCSTASGYHSFAQVVRSTGPVSVVIQVSGIAYTEQLLVNASFGLNVHLVTGYSTSAAQDQGFERGDGVCINQGTHTLGSYIEAGKAQILLQSGRQDPAEAYYSATVGVPLFSQAFKQFPAKTRLERAARSALVLFTSQSTNPNWAAPSKTPPAQVAALRAAFDAALANPACKTLLLDAAQSIAWVPGAQAKERFIGGLSILRPVASILAQ